MKIIGPVKSFTEYFTEVKAIYQEIEEKPKCKAPNALFFRGHSKTSYELLPSALRKCEKGSEKTYLLNYRDNMPRHSPPYHFIKQRPEILADMQHFGMKTRLLDWTFSPLIALYFALRSDSGEENSEVCVFNPWQYRHEFFKVSIERSSHAHDMHILARSLLSTHAAAEIENILKAEFYGETLKESDLKLPFPFVAKYGNPRLIHQSGCFTIHGLSNEGEKSYTALDCYSEVSSCSGIIHKILIQRESRPEMLNELNQLFINHYSVFPDPEGMSQHFRDYDSLYSVRREP